MTGGHLALLQEQGGGGYVFEQRSVSLLLLIPHPQASGLIISIPLNISQHCCIPLGLLIQSDADPFIHLFEFGTYDRCMYVLCLIIPSLSVKVSVGGLLASLAS